MTRWEFMVPNFEVKGDEEREKFREAFETLGIRAISRDASTYTVWTKTDDEEWIETNGTDKVALCGGLSSGEARFLRDRLRMMYGDYKVWIEAN